MCINGTVVSRASIRRTLGSIRTVPHQQYIGDQKQCLQLQESVPADTDEEIISDSGSEENHGNDNVHSEDEQREAARCTRPTAIELYAPSSYSGLPH